MSYGQITLPPPRDLGAPSRYDKWRRYQAEAVWAGAESKKRCVMQGQPTGSGKSLTYVCQALLTDSRTVILTSTKALMAQLADPITGDFIESGLIEIRGLNSYECVEGRPNGIFGNMRREGWRADRGLPMACDEAPCQSGAMCGKRDGGCLYYDAYRRASHPSTKLIVTNYAYWMSINRYGEGLGKVDMLVLDEAHNAFEELGKFVGTSIRQAELEAVTPGVRLPQPGADQHDWVAWAAYWLGKVVAELESIRQAIKDVERLGTNKTGEAVSYSTLRRARDLRNIQRKLATIAGMRDDWVIDWAEGYKGEMEVKFDPVAPGSYAESTLFINIPKIVMVSATARPETAMMLGLDRDQVDFKEYPSNFPVANRPVIYFPVGQMNRTHAAASKHDWHMAIDHIVGRRLNVKGIIHTVSYPRAREIFLNSEYRERMIMHDNTNTREIIAQFKASREPLILVSPVLSTGYDFPHDQARYQIIAKMPFPVTIDKVMKARNERWPWYKNYITMVELVQMAGRIVRAEDDWGETFIIDGDFGWWYYGKAGGRKMCANWFNESVRQEQILGPAMKGRVA